VEDGLGIAIHILVKAHTGVLAQLPVGHLALLINLVKLFRRQSTVAAMEVDQLHIVAAKANQIGIRHTASLCFL
jgi:hypothetical protein